MELTKDTFDDEDIEAYFHGAGVVPVAHDARGRTRLLLGRERFTQQYKGSCRWSGFEGTRKEGERVRETALRECFEESMGFAEPTLREGRRLVMRVTTPNKAHRYHCTYLVPVAWEEDLPARFATRRRRMEDLDYAVQEWRLAPDAPGLAARVEDCVAAAWKSAFHVVEDADGVVDVRLNMDFMEKDQIRWWTLPELREVLQHHGSSRGERFRPYFLPMLQLILEQVDDDSPPASSDATPCQECSCALPEEPPSPSLPPWRPTLPTEEAEAVPAEEVVPTEEAPTAQGDATASASAPQPPCP